MGFYVTEQLSQADVSRLRRQAKPETPLKKSRLEFFSASRSRAGFFAAQPVETHWETEPTPTIIVSGMSCWLSRDPIGEDGGANLYGFALNSPITTADPLSLYTLFFNPWWSWSNQEIDQVANTFYYLYAVIGRANSLVSQRLSLLDKQPNSCPFKRPLIQQYKFAQKALNGIGKGLNNRSTWISIEKNSNPSREASTSGVWRGWRILLSNLGSQNDVLHELGHHYGTDDFADYNTLYNANLFGNFANGTGAGVVNGVEASAKEIYGTKTCCPLPPAR